MSLDVHLKINEEEVYWANITHNLNRMAEAAGIYQALWRPEEIGATHARDIIEIVETGLKKMALNPTEYKKYDSPNGWGTYHNFLPWVAEYLQACKDNPDAEIEVSR